MKKFLRSPWYPFLFASYPVFSLLTQNITQVRETAGIRSFLVSFLGTGILFLAFRLIYRQWHRAAFVAASWVLLFFSYGQVYDVIHSFWKYPGLTPWILGIWLFLFLGVLFLASLSKIHFDSAAFTLNIISLGLIVYPSVLLLKWSNGTGAMRVNVPSGPDPVLLAAPGEILPDIYYLMPEDYGRADVLKKMDQIDDSQFMQYLKDTGFYVAECSQSNYDTSELSIGSSLNMDYLQNLGPGFTAASVDQGPIWNAIRYNAVSSDLKNAGYTTVAFATGFSWSELDNADVYISPPLLWSALTAFETLLLRTTPLRHLDDLNILNFNELDGDRYRERTLLDFNSADTLAKMPGPKFVFMQIIAPHPPFVFDPNGAKTDPSSFLNEENIYTEDKYTQGFRNEVPFVNQEIEDTITTLIEKSARPLVIVLQTDTGPWLTSGPDTFKILNAYYMPGHTQKLYPSISPVNTFRVIMDAYLGANLPLLDDISYYSPIPHIYDFSKVSNSCLGG
ncbi:MAG TPA: hypothetical protein VMC09_02350 [Anaerolineales bacterium]|nr:hypothetical protein [Anaerolineales bacterium]